MQKANFKSKLKSEKFEDKGESCKSWGKFYNTEKKETVIAHMQITKNNKNYKLILPQTRSKSKRKHRTKNTNKLVISNSNKFEITRKNLKSPINEVENVSKCGNYRSFLNATGLNYIRCKTTEEVFQTEKRVVYKTLQECQNRLIGKLNDYGKKNGADSFKFHLRPSGKFLNVRCANCKTFYYQYKNQDNLEMS